MVLRFLNYSRKGYNWSLVLDFNKERMPSSH